MRAPADSATLSSVLVRHAVRTPARPAFCFLGHDGREEETLTYGELQRRASCLGAALTKTAQPGARVLLLGLPPRAFVPAFFGCLAARLVAVPTPLGERPSSLRQRIADADPCAILAPAASLEVLRAEFDPQGRLIWLDPLQPILANGSIPSCTPRPDDLAVLQYTSGSTSEPRGAEVLQANLLANSAMIQAGFGHDSDSTFVSWLPLFHDMGLVGSIVQPVMLGALSVLLTPESFLERPARWLHAVSRYRAHTSGAPNFAYQLCARRVDPREIDLDLSNWKVAFNGAEPISAATLECFANTFAPAGFKPEAFYPCYGMAEATLFVCGGVPGRPPTVRRFSRDVLEAHGTAKEHSRQEGLALVGLGDAFPPGTLAIVDAERRRCAPGVVGEVWVAGPHVVRGYWQRPAETRESFAEIALDAGDPQRWLRTGDLGFLWNGELFVVGRSKEVIIIGGRNHAPAGIEATSSAAHPAAAHCRCAAFGVPGRTGERLVVLQEVRTASNANTVLDAIGLAIRDTHGVQPHALALLVKGSLPITTSGKTRRHEARAAFLSSDVEGILAERTRPLPEVAGVPTVEAVLRRLVAEACATTPAALDLTSPAVSLGLDSFGAMAVLHGLEDEIGVVLPLPCLLGSAPLQDVLDAITTTPPSRDPAIRSPSPNALTRGQEALWLLDRQAAGGAFNLSFLVRLGPTGNTEALYRAVRHLAQRHPELRTRLELVDGVPRQRPLVFDPIREMEEHLPAPEALLSAAHSPFDLEREPPWRVHSYLDGGDPVLLVTVHHLVADGWSLLVLATDLQRLYCMASAGHQLPPPRCPRDRRAAEDRWLTSGNAAALDYWRKVLGDGGPPALSLPLDRVRTDARTSGSHLERFHLGPLVTTAINRLAREANCTPYTVVLTGFISLLLRWTGQESVAVGTPISGRDRLRDADWVSHFANPIVVVGSALGDPTFQALLEQVREGCLQGLTHSGLPFPLLVEQLGLSSAPNRHPVFDAVFVWHMAPPGLDPHLAALAVPGSCGRIKGELTLEALPDPAPETGYDLQLVVAPEGDGLAGALVFDAGLFCPETAQAFSSQLQTLLRGVAEGRCDRLSALPLLSHRAADRVSEWERVVPARVTDRCLHDLVAEQVAHRPRAIALSGEGIRCTYAELDRSARRLAMALQTTPPGAPVAVLLTRAPERAVALLGVLQAGAAFVALQPDWPSARLAAVLTDVDPARIVVDTDSFTALPAHFAARTLRVGGRMGGNLFTDQPEPAAAPLACVAPTDPAYVVYTSGSTGSPQGIAHSHRTLAQFAAWQARACGIKLGGRVAQLAPIGFDVAYCEIFGAWAVGATLCLLERETLTREELGDWLHREEVSLVQVVPTLFQRLLLDALPADAELPHLRTVLFVGEALPVALVCRARARFPKARFIQVYGPSEAIAASFHPLDDLEPNQRVAPIGRPIAGRGLSVRDERGAPCPVGVLGELVIRSRYLAEGYVGDPARSREAFRPLSDCRESAQAEGIREYATGDLARWLPDGTLAFAGRRDLQVKVHGVRIELEEVEAAFRRQPGVLRCVVLHGPECWIAFVEGVVDPALLRTGVATTLPPALIPTAIVCLRSLPETPNGKVDRQALRGLPASYEPSGAPPQTPREERIAAVWSELLGRESIPRDANFFSLGGHSLLAARVLNRLRENGVQLQLGVFLREPTVAGLARAQKRAERDSLATLESLLAHVEALATTQVETELMERRRRS